LRREGRDRVRGLSGAEEDSGGGFEGLLACLLPVERRQLGDVLVGDRGQALQHVFRKRYAECLLDRDTISYCRALSPTEETRERHLEGFVNVGEYMAKIAQIDLSKEYSRRPSSEK